MNCGKCCGTAGSQWAIIDAVVDVLLYWGVIFLSEVDAVRGSDTNDYPIHYSSRHWPGEGSFAMKFIVRQCLRQMVRSITWRGRCGALHIFQRGPVLGNHSNIYIIGIHVAHGDLQIDTLSDIAFLLRHRPWGSRVLVAGDWNIDQLPSLAIDPFSDHPGRDQHHQAERVLVQSLVDRFHLSLFVPEVVCSTPGGPFDDACRASPITRIPVGEAASYCSPSLLDYAAASENLVTESHIHWHGVPADHALVTFSISPV